MSDDMEQIEARLAGYIDGTLPPEQRAEIEAYLAANPTHARLITELQSIKTAVGNLPRDKAPAEVMDAIQSQLERHVLLDGVEDGNGPPRINRWPQLGAVAAMLLLMAGLGLLVYQVLPRQKGVDAGLALLPSSTRAIVPDAELPDAAPVTLDAAPPVALKVRKDEVVRAALPSTKSSEANAGVPSDAFAKQEGETQPAVNAAVVPQEPSPTPSPSAETTRPDAIGYVVIRTADPVMTRNLVAATLAAAGHSAEAGEVKAATALATLPTTQSDASVGRNVAGRDVDSATTEPTGGPAVAGDAYLIVRDLQAADIDRLRVAAGAPGAVMPDQAGPPSTAATHATRNWMLVFRTASAAPAAVPVSRGLPTTAPAATLPTTAASRVPSTSPAMPLAPEAP